MSAAGIRGSVSQAFWKRHPDGPFATLVRVASTYLHPEADDLESIQRLAKREDGPEMRVFKDELRQAVVPPPARAPATSSRHVRYDDGSPEKFLRRLWVDIFGDESVPGPGQG